MTKKRQPNSSVVSVLDDDNLNLNDLGDDENIDIDTQDDIAYMNMDTHYALWTYIGDYYPEEIENKKGMQKYLKYCKDNGITKEKIEKETNTNDIKNIMKFYKDKTKRKDDR